MWRRAERQFGRGSIGHVWTLRWTQSLYRSPWSPGHRRWTTIVVCLRLSLLPGCQARGSRLCRGSFADRFGAERARGGRRLLLLLARGAIQPWLPESKEQNEVAARAAASAAGRYAAGGFVTVYDGVVEPGFSQRSSATGLDRVDYVVLLPSVERCVERVVTRRCYGFNDEAATRKMHKEFAQAAIDQRHHLLVDPPDQPEDVADLVVPAIKQQSLVYRYPQS